MCYVHYISNISQSVNTALIKASKTDMFTVKFLQLDTYKFKATYEY